MTDRKKVILGLKCHMKNNCQYGGTECPYWDDDKCSEHLCRDALALLREQEPEIVRCKDCEHYEANTGRCAKGNTHGYADTWTCGDAERR